MALGKTSSSSQRSSLWQDAYQRLSPKTKSYFPIDAACTAHEVQVMVNEEVRDARARQLKAKTFGKTFFVRDALEKAFTLITRFIEVGDVAIQYDPGHAALPWAAIRFILKVSVSYMEQYAAIHEGLEEVLKALVWARIQERLYAGIKYDLRRELERNFVSLYYEAFHFLAKACHFLQQSRTRHVITSITASASKYKKRRSLIAQKKATIIDFSSQIARENQLEQISDLRQANALLERLEAPVRRVERYTEDVFQVVKKFVRDDVLNWTSRAAYQRQHNERRKKILQGTGGWLLNHPSFHHWKDSSYSEILWLHGMLGSGKSTLLSIVLEKLMEESEQSGGPLPVYFYCARNAEERERSDPEQVMLNILRQISTMGRLDFVHAVLKSRYDDRVAHGTISFDESVDLTLRIINDCPITYMVVDALDELSTETRTNFIEIFERLLQESPNLVKIFVTSRDDLDILLSMTAYPNISISASDNQEDIALYVRHSVKQLIQQKRLLPTQPMSEELKDQIEQTLCEKAQGMFRWVELQLQFLCTVTLPGAIKKRLGQLPQKLSEIYEQLYHNQINTLPGEEVEIMNAALSWLMVAERRLRSKELIALVSVGKEAAGEVTKDSVLSLCFNIIQYNDGDDSFSFVHLSVREFLENGPEIFHSRTLQNMAAQTCFAALREEGVTCDRQLDYVLWFWPNHSSHALSHNDKRVHTEIRTFLRPGTVEFFRWSYYIKGTLRKTGIQDDTDEARRLRTKVGLILHPLFIAFEFGFHAVAADIVQNMSYSELKELKNSQNENVLHLAGRYGYTEVIERLLELGFDIDQEGGFCGSALQAATFQDHVDAVQLLVNKGANVNARGGYYGSVAEIARSRGHDRIKHLLDDRGADDPAIAIASLYDLSTFWI